MLCLGARTRSRIVIRDITAPLEYKQKSQFERLDVRDRDRVHAVLERTRPDALVHLALMLKPLPDEHLMYDVDVNGTHNVLEAPAVPGFALAARFSVDDYGRDVQAAKALSRSAGTE